MDMFLPDVDGVLTDSHAQPNKEALRLVANLSHEHAVHLVTGRGAGWLTQNILGELSKHFDSRPPQVAGPHCAEYGGILLYWSKEGWVEQMNPNFTPIPSAARQKIKEEVQGIRGVFFDDDKRVMVSLEANHALAAEDP